MVEDVSEERSPTWTPLAAKVICAGGEGGRSGGGISSISSFEGTGVLDMLPDRSTHKQSIVVTSIVKSKLWETNRQSLQPASNRLRHFIFGFYHNPMGFAFQRNVLQSGYELV